MHAICCISITAGMSAFVLSVKHPRKSLCHVLIALVGICVYYDLRRERSYRFNWHGRDWHWPSVEFTVSLLEY